MCTGNNERAKTRQAIPMHYRHRCRKKTDGEQTKKTFQGILSNKTDFKENRGKIRRQIRTKCSTRLPNTLVDPENPPLDVPRYNRLHPTFRKAVL